MIGSTIARYRIDRRLGEGGMGEVYAARDLELEREVALKAIRQDLADPNVKARFWREARAAAQLDHPNICQIHEVLEQDGRLFIVMELLRGETLADRIARGPLPASEVVSIGLEILDALGALHQRRLVHRDVKPSNVFLMEDGRVKLLDLGLVGHHGRLTAGGTDLTASGMLMGSPRYMAPEQIRGAELDGRADLFALAAVLHEALTGRAAFHGKDPVEVMYAVLNHRPSALGGSADLEALSNVLLKALTKNREQRPANAAQMAADLRAVRTPGGFARAVAVERIVRLGVLPFRMLRPDPELDFLGASLADAIAMSLAGIRSLVVRSPAAAARFAGQTPDLEQLASVMEVDVVLMGTILPAQGRCRVAAQLIETPSGSVLWSQTSDATGRDAFELQDQLAHRIVESLHLPLTARERSALGSDVPASPTAYEYFLRANRATIINADLGVARDLCLRAVQEDPGFAPAWVSLGRLYRLLGKYSFESGSEENLARAREALDRALDLHPDLPAAHHVTAQYEMDSGEAERAIERLCGVIERNPNDPQGFNGLIQALRYVGLLEGSLAAFRRVRRLDPQLVTSVLHTYDAIGEHEKALAEATTAFGFDRARLLAVLGRREEALATVNEVNKVSTELMAYWGEAIVSAIHGDAARARRLDRLWKFPDPEGLAMLARCRVKAGDTEGGLAMLDKAVRDGYVNVRLYQGDPWLEPVRGDRRFVDAVERARERHDAARARFDRVLGTLQALAEVA